MVVFDKTLLGIEKSLLGNHQNFIDAFSDLLKKSSNFNGVKRVPDTEISDIEKKISRESIPARDREKGYGLEDIQKDLENLISIARRDEIFRVDYVEVTQAVLNVDKTRGEISDSLGEFLLAIKKQYQLILSDFKTSISNKSQLSLIDSQKQAAIICVGKAIEHARLAHLQYNFLYLETQEEVNRVQDDINANFGLYFNVRDDLTKFSNDLDKISDKQSSIYTDFVAILGVFSSFVFVMFGGFSSLSDIISALSDTYVSIEKVVLIASFLMGSMFTIVYSLIVWISKIIGKSIIVKSCECNICRDPWHAFLRHKLYSIIMTTLVAVFIISLGVTIFVNIGDEFQTINVSRFILLSNLTLIVVLTLLYRFLLWIAKFTRKSFKKCYSPKCQGDCLHKYKHLFYRHPFYFCVIFILIFFICIPYIYQFIDKYVVEWIPK